MTENKNMLNIKMDNKEMIRIGAIAVLILDVILMLSAYINIDAINQLANLVSGFSETNIDSGSGKYTLFGVISLVRKFIVLYNGGDYIFGSYICYFLLDTSYICCISNIRRSSESDTQKRFFIFKR